jgi:hypothetical protein
MHAKMDYESYTQKGTEKDIMVGTKPTAGEWDRLGVIGT